MLRLPAGTRLEMHIEQDPQGFTLTIHKRVGSRTKQVSTKRVASEADLWLAIARWADGKLAQLGLEVTQ